MYPVKLENAITEEVLGAGVEISATVILDRENITCSVDEYAKHAVSVSMKTIRRGE